MPATNAITTNMFNDLVKEERKRQDTKWGEQDHTVNKWLNILDSEMSKLEGAVDKHANSNMEIDRRIVQVAAVCQVMWESGVRNGWI